MPGRGGAFNRILGVDPVNELVALYLRAMERRGLSKATIYKVRLSLRAVDNQVGLVGASREDLERFLDGRRLAPRTRYWWVSMLSCFYAWAVTEGRVESNPVEGIVRPRLRRTLPRPISEHDLDVALALAEPRMRAWLTLAAYAGLRVAEIATLEREHIMEGSEPPMIRVCGKGGHERLVPLHPRVWETVRACGLPRRGRVFTTPQGCGISPARLSRMVAVYLDNIGLEATAHQLRHRFATRCYARSHDLRAVQELLGHASPTTTSIYVAWDRGPATRAVMGL